MNSVSKLPALYEYIHYTGRDTDTLDLNRVYTQSPERLAVHAPNGLWLSIPGIHDWEQYCVKNNCHLDALKNEFQILLNPQARILILDNKAAFEDFIKEFGYYKENQFTLSIRWDKIFNNYQGIALPRVFTPKQKNTIVWNKTWCCTSACVWDLQAVRKVEKQ